MQAIVPIMGARIIFLLMDSIKKKKKKTLSNPENKLNLQLKCPDLRAVVNDTSTAFYRSAN